LPAPAAFGDGNPPAGALNSGGGNARPRSTGQNHLMTTIRKWITTPNVLALFGLAVAAVGAWSVVASLIETIPARSWPATQGEVVRSHYEIKEYRSRFESGHVYVPSIRYRYMIDGRVFQSDRTWTGRRYRAKTLRDVHAFLADYPKGGPISVRYDPAEPARSTLFVETDYEMTIMCGAGLFLLALSGLMRWFGRKTPAGQP
jgi:hypothetical protein